jgi:hypothetical protein
LATACGGGSDKKSSSTTVPGGTPETTAVIEVTTEPPTTAPPETVKGTPRTVTTLSTAMGPGGARIVGTVTGPEGPVTGAVVRVERFVGSAVANTEVRSQAGSWAIESVLGGSYRVTIFRPPDLTETAPDVFFLGADETKTLTTTLVRLGGDGSVTATIDPNPPLVGLPALLTVRFGSGGVDAQGTVIFTPRPGVRAQLNLGSGIGLESALVVITDGAGAAAWQVRCLLPGLFPASILVGNASSALILPPCTAAPAAPAPAPTTVP